MARQTKEETDRSLGIRPTSESAKPDGYLVTRYEGRKAVEVLYRGTVPLGEHDQGRPVWFAAPIAQTADALSLEQDGWYAAAMWLRNHYQDYPNIADLASAMECAGDAAIAAIQREGK
jgi:hypothetical protein